MASCATYTKLRDGSWGIRSTVELRSPRCLVTKRSGEEKSEAVGRLVWSGNSVWIYSIDASAPQPRIYQERRNYGCTKRIGCECMNCLG